MEVDYSIFAMNDINVVLVIHDCGGVEEMKENRCSVAKP